MRKCFAPSMLASLLLCVLLMCMGGATAMATVISEDAPSVEGLTIDNLSTRSGPSTAYRETDTYKVKGEWIRIISYAYDDGGVCWLQCDVPYGGKLRRVYTGLKRFDATTVDLTAIPEENALDYETVSVLTTSKALFGPGDAYGEYKTLTVDKRQKVTLIAIEGDYAQVEWKTTKQKYRAWVPYLTLDVF